MGTNDNFVFSILDDVQLEVEVSPDQVSNFAKRYMKATKELACGNSNYKEQKNKWGMELKVFFNSKDLYQILSTRNIDVCLNTAYNTQYKYRLNNNEIWWDLVENFGFRLGLNKKQGDI